MTLIAGFTVGDHVVLAADSALTVRGGDPTGVRKHSLFGGLQHQDGKVVSEEATKLFKVRDNAAVAIAGDSIARAAECVEALLLWNHGDRVSRASLESWTRLVAKKKIRETLEFLIAYRDDGPHLLRWTTDAPDQLYDVEQAWAGSGCAVYDTELDSLSRELRRQQAMQMADRLVMTSARLQAITGATDSHRFEVGGAFVSASVGSDGVSRQPDITYIPFNPRELNDCGHRTSSVPEDPVLSIGFELTTVWVRHGTTFVMQRAPEADPILLIVTNPLDDDYRLLEASASQLEAELMDSQVHFRARYYVFLRRASASALALKTSAGLPCHQFDAKFVSRELLQIRIGDALKTGLAHFGAQPFTGSAEFRLVDDP